MNRSIPELELSEEDLARLNSTRGLTEMLRQPDINLKRTLRRLRYEDQLQDFQIEMLKLQNWVRENGKRIVLIFEGRDVAGKGGAIRRFTEHLNPRTIRVVALPKPSDKERGQWYFQRYISELPNPGEIVFFNRSWYNRGVVEPVNGFCTEEQYAQFLMQVKEFEKMLFEDGIQVIKFWFSIDKKEQIKRLHSIKNNPLKQWQLSPIDAKAQRLWDKYTYYKDQMFLETSWTECPWVVLLANTKPKARLEAMKYVLGKVPYPKNKDIQKELKPDPEVLKVIKPKVR